MVVVILLVLDVVISFSSTELLSSLFNFSHLWFYFRFYYLVACLIVKTSCPMDVFMGRGDISALFGYVVGRGVTSDIRA
jgi:hypothetical protein